MGTGAVESDQSRDGFAALQANRFRTAQVLDGFPTVRATMSAALTLTVAARVADRVGGRHDLTVGSAQVEPDGHGSGVRYRRRKHGVRAPTSMLVGFGRDRHLDRVGVFPRGRSAHGV